MATSAADIQRIVSPREGRRQPEIVLYRCWPAAHPRAALIIVHGLGGHSDRYQECAGRWSAAGISTYAPDLRGFGHTPGPKGHVDSFQVYHHDLEILLARVMAENSRRPIFLLGESMGGILSVDFIARRPALLSGLILIAPSLRDRLGVPLRLKAGAFLNVLIRRRQWYDVPWNPDDFTRDQAVIDYLNRDPLEVRKVTAQFYFAYTPVAARARREASRLNLPVLVMLPGDDRMIDSDYTKAYFERIASPDKELREYPGYYHALLLDLERERIHEDVAGWVSKRS